MKFIKKPKNNNTTCQKEPVITYQQSIPEQQSIESFIEIQTLLNDIQYLIPYVEPQVIQEEHEHYECDTNDNQEIYNIEDSYCNIETPNIQNPFEVCFSTDVTKELDNPILRPVSEDEIFDNQLNYSLNDDNDIETCSNVFYYF